MAGMDEVIELLKDIRTLLESLNTRFTEHFQTSAERDAWEKRFRESLTANPINGPAGRWWEEYKKRINELV